MGVIMENNSTNNIEENELQQLASKKVAKLKSFYKYTFFYIIALAVYLLKEFTELPLHSFPFQFINGVVMSLWTAVYISCVIDMVVSFKFLGREWEERKLRSLLEKKNKVQKWE
jgi:hypothetical protein